MDSSSFTEVLQICRYIRIKFRSWTHMYTALILGKTVTQTNQSKFDETLFSEIYFVQITFKTRKRNTGFQILRQGGTLQRWIC